jgi:hypothetical protein
MDMKKFVRRLQTSEAEDVDLEELRGQSPEEKLSILQDLRNEYYRFTNEDRKGFQRVFRIVEQTGG